MFSIAARSAAWSLKSVLANALAVHRAALVAVTAFCLMVPAVAQLQSGSPWPKVYGNLQNTNHGLGYGATGLLEWTWGTSSDKCSSGVISANGTLYFGDTHGTSYYLVSLNSITGALNWQFRVNSPIKTSPAIGSDGTIYAASGQLILAITDHGSSATGKWAYTAGGTIEDAPSIASDGSIIFGADDFNFYSLKDNGSSISVNWTFTSGDKVVAGATIGSDGTIYFSSNDDFFNSFDSFGDILNSFLTDSQNGIPAESGIDPTFGTTVALADNYAYLIDSNFNNYWTANPTSAILRTPAFYDNFFFLPTSDSPNNKLLGYEIAHSGGYSVSSIGTFTADGSVTAPSVVTDSEGTIYFASDKLYCFTQFGNSPTPSWTYPIAPNAPMAMDANGTLFMPGGAAGGFSAIGSNPFISFSLDSSTVTSGANNSSNPINGTIQLAAGLTSQQIAGITFQFFDGQSQTPEVYVIGQTAGANNTLSVQFGTYAISNGEQVTVKAVVLSRTIEATLNLNAATITNFTTANSLSTPTANIVGGTNMTGTVTISGTTYFNQNQGIFLSSSSGDLVVPSQAYLYGGSNAATFTATTSQVATVEAVTLTASYGNSSQQVTVYLQPPSVIAFSMSPNSIVGGTQANGTVIIGPTAGSNGAVVSLSSSSTDAAIPSSVTVTSGNTSAAVQFNTSAVSTSEQITLTATYNSTSLQATLTLNPAAITGFSVSPQNTIVGGAGGSGTVTLGGATGANGDVVSLSSSSTDVQVPSSVTVANGSETATFQFTTSGVASSEVITLTATLGSSTAQAQFTLTPVAMTYVSLDSEVIIGGQADHLTVNLNGPAGTNGFTANLFSPSSDVSVPMSLTVASGATSGTVQIHTLPVSSTEHILLTAIYNNVGAPVLLTLMPATLTGIRVAPTALQGGASGALAVYLNSAAGPQGDTVSLSSSSTDVTVPSSVTVGSGATAANVAFQTAHVSSSEQVIFTATYGSATLQTTVTLNPAALTGIRVAPTALEGGASGALAVYLNGLAGASGDVVSLSSSSADVTVPSSVTVPQGTTDANVALQTSVVSSTEQVTLSATFGTTTLSTSITLNPPMLSGLKLQNSSVIGGFPTALAVYLNARSGTSGATVNLLSSSADVALPSSVTIPAGSASANVVVHTKAVDSPEQVTLTATIGASTLNTTLTVNPAALSAIKLSPSTTSNNNTPLKLAVYLNGPAGPSGTVVSISHTGEALIYGSITVPAGATSANITVYFASSGTITAALGSVSLQTQVTFTGGG